ncbi:hypothetical protein SD28_04870 [Allofrancisella guangzhouensis]|uniref:Uncharacterized protein n=2 Tax=Allofrancisella guangzhouensis TaxID=594679 RepID=A0A0A8E5Z0_9GAMM|nr:hypothetical protein [Allofrancisella guangzhouensis]AJC49012.1 hypothetical protein SD28_04870 [Allofrancisella guangzhouensis]MBK2027558.1 hypothetical protein [Allofrancisella guangzhouensis]
MEIIECHSCGAKWNSISVFPGLKKDSCYRCGSTKIYMVHINEFNPKQNVNLDSTIDSKPLILTKQSSLNENAFRKGVVTHCGALNHYDQNGHLFKVGTYTVKDPYTTKYQDLRSFEFTEEFKGKCGGLTGTVKVLICDKFIFYKKHSDNVSHVNLWNKIYKGTGYDVAFYFPRAAYYPEVPGITIDILGHNYVELDLKSELLRASHTWLIKKMGLFQQDFCSPEGIIFNSQNVLYQVCNLSKIITFYPIDVATICDYSEICEKKQTPKWLF